MLTVNYLRRSLYSLLLMMWVPMPIWAATLAVDAGGFNEFANVSFPVLALAFSLSTLSGATALVWRLDKELRASPDGKLPRPWLFASSNMLGSWTAGALAWLMAQSQGVGVYSTLIIVILLSFGGARALEVLAEKYINRDASPIP